MSAPWPRTIALRSPHGHKGHRAQWIDEYLLSKGIRPANPSKENEDPNARLVTFDREQYRQRNIVERLIGWLKKCRRILTRFEKRASSFLSMIKWAFVQRYLSHVLLNYTSFLTEPIPRIRRICLPCSFVMSRSILRVNPENQKMRKAAGVGRPSGRRMYRRT